MNPSSMPCLLIFALLAASAASSQSAAVSSRPITAVVKQLQAMSEKSEADGEEEVKIFEKFKCYCDKTLANTTKQMALLTEEIASTKSRIEALIALGRELAQRKAQTEKDMKENEQAQAEATAVRKKANEAFLVEEKDLSDSLAQLNDALETLTAGAEGEEKPALLEVTRALDKASLRGSALLEVPSKQESQTGGVAGVLKSTRDTYVTNLEELRNTEAAQLKAFNGFIETKTNEYKSLEAMLAAINSGIADTEEELGQRKTQLATAEDNLEKTIAFDEETKALCKEKTEIHEQRAMLRAQEDAAISKAIAVLNSDEAFHTFGKSKATGFMQLKSVKMHSVDQRRPLLLNLLEQAAHSMHSARLAGIAALVSTGNPFNQVVSAIEKAQERIAQEGEKDKRQFDTCKSDREKNNAAKQEKTEQIVALTAAIDSLQSSIDEMTVTLNTRSEELANNDNEQKAQTELRKSENLEYQQNIALLLQTQDLIAKGTKVLRDYYDSIEEQNTKYASFLQVRQPEPPQTNDGKYEGQTEAGATVLKLLDDIMADSKAEEKAAHENEQKSQLDFEDSMKALTDEEASLKEAISKTEGDLAQAKLDSDSKKASLLDTQAEKKAIEEFLASIKSDCDFIAQNFDLREESRAAETQALTAAIEGIKGTPAYKKAEAQATLEESPTYQAKQRQR